MATSPRPRIPAISAEDNPPTTARSNGTRIAFGEKRFRITTSFHRAVSSWSNWGHQFADHVGAGLRCFQV